jgi:hypothetical protein
LDLIFFAIDNFEGFRYFEMFTEEAIEISKKKSASISIFHDDEGKQYFFQNFDR